MKTTDAPRTFLLLSLLLAATMWATGCLPAADVATPTLMATAQPLPSTATVSPDDLVPLPTWTRLSVPATWTPPSPPTSAPTVTPTLAPQDEDSPDTSQTTPPPVATIPTNTPVPPTLTPTPVTPTATPYESEIPDLPDSGELGPSKLGVHVITNNSPNIMQFVRDARPAVMKGVGDLGFLQEVKQVSPGTVTIGRINIAHQSYTGTPQEAALDFVNSQLAQYLANPYVDYWEGWNEPDPNLDRMPWYAQFESERVRLLAGHGLKAAVGGFATGIPELDEFVLFMPAIETAIEYNGILSLHEYSAPDIDWLFGDPIPGYPAYPDRGSWAFRYRWYYKDYLEPAGLVLPLVISEAGIDGILANERPGPAGLGWTDFVGYWQQQGTWGETGVEAYINQLNWYDNGVRQDGYVIGFTVFTAGGGSQWSSYEINGILPDLADYVISQR